MKQSECLDKQESLRQWRFEVDELNSIRVEMQIARFRNVKHISPKRDTQWRQAEMSNWWKFADNALTASHPDGSQTREALSHLHVIEKPSMKSMKSHWDKLKSHWMRTYLWRLPVSCYRRYPSYEWMRGCSMVSIGDRLEDGLWSSQGADCKRWRTG